MQAELLQQEIINRQRLSIATDRLLVDLPKQAQAAEDRMSMAEYVRGYQLVSVLTFRYINLVMCAFAQTDKVHKVVMPGSHNPAQCCLAFIVCSCMHDNFIATTAHKLCRSLHA